MEVRYVAFKNTRKLLLNLLKNYVSLDIEKNIYIDFSASQLDGKYDYDNYKGEYLMNDYPNVNSIS